MACLLAIYAFQPQWTDAYIVPKWMFALLAVAGMGMALGLRLLYKIVIHESTIHYIMVVAVLSIVLALHGILQYIGCLPSMQDLPIGNFDNAAGYAGCLCAGIPFCLFLCERKVVNKYLGFIIGYGGCLLGMVAVCLAQSRAGFLGIFAAIVTFAFFRYQLFRKKWVVSIILGSLFFLLLGGYYLKKDSADGRLLIWRVACEMIRDKPIMGHGSQAVEACYMDYQADYFFSHPNCSYQMLGDNVKHLFNEYLTLAVRYGVIGCIALFVALAFIGHGYRQNPVAESRIAICSLIGIGTCACFSYPCTYPFVWIVLLLNVYLIVYNACFKRNIYKKYRALKLFGGIILILSIILTYKVAIRMRAESEWGKISFRSLQEETERMLPYYEKLLPVLEDVPYFLYNYAAEFYMAGHFQKAFEVANQCRAYWADYDLELLQGEISKGLKDRENAKKHFMLASQMCPARFIPLYQIYGIYLECGDTVNMFCLGKQILNKPVKVNSQTVSFIKQCVQRDLQE